jgi:hypothetical protein
MPQDESSTNGSKADESDEDKVAKFDNVEPSGFHKSHPIEAMTISYNDHDTEDNNPHFITQESKANLTNRRHLVNQRTVEFGKVRRIQTMFAHPIHLAGDPDYPREGPHCNWCSNFAYGVVGLGIRNPEVIDFGTKMVEIEGGHTGEGKYETRMCLECVCHRIKIIQCTHASVGLLRLPGTERGASEEIEEYGRFIRACNILNSQSTQATGPSFSSNREWCGICQKTAAWTCKTPQGASIGVAIIDCDELQYGCGLHLCDLCRETLSRCRGNLNSVYDNYAGEQGVLRADVEFILSGAERNVLYKRMLID